MIPKCSSRVIALLMGENRFSKQIKNVKGKKTNRIVWNSVWNNGTVSDTSLSIISFSPDKSSVNCYSYMFFIDGN